MQPFFRMQTKIINKNSHVYRYMYPSNALKLNSMINNDWMTLGKLISGNEEIIRPAIILTSNNVTLNNISYPFIGQA